jgi:hypothetical protein
MKILYLNSGMHHKNQHAINNYKNIEFVTIYSLEQLNQFNLIEFDCVFSPCESIDVSLYPNTKFLFGPHNFLFPDENIERLKGDKTIYIQPSLWPIHWWVSTFPICSNLNLKVLPFGVDTERFNEIKPFSEREKVMVYTKHRSFNDINLIKEILKLKNINYKIFDYDQRYSENDYLEYLQDSKYAIIVDAHESQGFALLEVMSCNVPLFIWSVKSMNQEAGQNYPDFPATTIPYWDPKCGEFFYDFNEIVSTFDLFLNRLELGLYKPREFILENLSMEKCEKKLIDLIKNI